MEIETRAADHATSTETETTDVTPRAQRALRWTMAGAALAALGTAATLRAALTGGVEIVSSGPGQAVLAGAPPVPTAWALTTAGAVVTAGLIWLAERVRAVADGRVAPGWTRPRVGVAAATLLVATAVLATVCDAMLLAVAGYLPMLLIGSIFSPEMREGLALVAQPTVLLQLGVVTATLVTFGAVLAALDSLRGGAALAGWLQPGRAARWGRVAAWVAVAVPVLYAFTRVAWVLGWPIGFDVAAYEEAGGDLRPGLGLAAGAVVGAVLTTGLVRPWGERFWAWVPALGGRPVPVWLAVVPASVVAALLLPAGVSMIRVGIDGGGIATILSDLGANWAAVGVTFLWPVWSLALAAATLGYALRRRGIRAAA